MSLKKTLRRVVAGASIATLASGIIGGCYYAQKAQEINCEQFINKNIHYASQNVQDPARIAYTNCLERKRSHAQKGKRLPATGVGVALLGLAGTYLLREEQDNT